MGMFEQTYKWRDIDELTTPDHISKIVDNSFLEACISQFKTMQQAFSATLQRNI